jgi:hypothetical protein
VTSNRLSGFDEVWCVDFEYISRPGELPDVLCLCAQELRTGRPIQLWRDGLTPVPPYRTDERALFVCFAATAECICHLTLGWPLPARVLDLSPLFRNLINGQVPPPEGKGLIGALRHFGLDTVGAKYKEGMRDRILAGPPFSDEEKACVLEYCASDIEGLPLLMEKLLPSVALELALHWGEFAAVSAAMEFRGVPIDMEIFAQLRDKRTWAFVRDALVPRLNPQYGVYVEGGDDGWHFSEAAFEDYLARSGIGWPRHEATGKLDLRSKTFDSMAKAFPELESLRQLRHTRSKMRQVKLAVGADARNRTTLWPFTSKTSRSQPKASQWIFSPAVWLRPLIKPAAGCALAYIDCSAMEFLIAGALSGCQQMLELYASGSPYLEFAKRVDAAPPSATKATHPGEHERYKVVCLGAQYQMQHVTLAQRLSLPSFAAWEMLNQHRGLFSTYWAWVDDWIAHALNTGTMQTPLGWVCRTGVTELNARSIGNFPVQGCGADILRVACIMAHRRGLQLCGSIHDAVLIESSLERIDADVVLMREIFRRASRAVIGHDMRTGIEIIRYPNRYVDRRGVEMWTEVLNLLAQYRQKKQVIDAAGLTQEAREGAPRAGEGASARA